MKEVKVLNFQIQNSEQYQPLNSSLDARMTHYPGVEKELELWMNQGWIVEPICWQGSNLSFLLTRV